LLSGRPNRCRSWRFSSPKRLHSARASASLFSVGIELTGEFCPIAGADAIQNAATIFRFHVGGKTALGGGARGMRSPRPPLCPSIPSISLGRSQHFVHLSCPQTVQGPFSSEETAVRKEKEHSSKVIQPTTRTEDFESLFQAVQQLAVFELPHGKTRRVRPSVIPGNHLSPVIQFQNGRLGNAKLSRRLFR
jgi:hypothetical protein